MDRRCPPPAGNGAIFEEGAVQQSAAGVAGVQAALPQLPNACTALAKAKLAGGAAGGAAGAAGGAAAGAAGKKPKGNWVIQFEFYDLIWGNGVPNLLFFI